MHEANLRRFADHVPSIAEDWFNNPVQTISVRRLGDYSASADGACRVEFAEGRVGFVKPRGHPQTLVVANEKIASDFGYLLGLPVAPVVVRTPQAETEWDRFTALSLACLSAGRHWCEGGPGVNGDTVVGLEALRVFWTWLGDTDHNQHPQNLLYERDLNGRTQLLAIDHSYILGQGADPLTSPVCHGYASADHEAADPVRRDAIERIEALDDALLQNVVHRLVGSVLTSAEAESTVKWLAARRGTIRKLLILGGDND